ncbi:MAG: hypothetical protein U0172_03560 [Nitrospiraceae bacterium]
MTELEFKQGWALLVAQPYGREYALDEARLKAALRSWFGKLQGFSFRAFERVVVRWIEKETRFPLLPDILALVRDEQRRMEAEVRRNTPERSLSDMPYIPLSLNEIMAYATKQGMTMFDAIRQWEQIVAEKEQHAEQEVG